MMKSLKYASAFATNVTLLGLVISHNALGVIPEPDNLLYGSITLDNVPVTATWTDVVLEARRTTNGPAIASYRMGDDAALGDFYALRLSLESVAPITNSSASQTGDTLIITLLDGTGVRAQTSFLIVERGVAQRVDFGPVVIDGDGDGLPDAWELLHYPNLGAGANSLAANGQTTWQHYLAGTDPNDPEGGFRLFLTESNNLKHVSFVAVRAEGPGYEGMTRRYTLESNPAAVASGWSGVTSFVDLPGDNQTVVYQTAGAGDAGFFRGRIALLPASSPAVTNDTDSDGLPDNWETFHFGNLMTNASSLNLNQQTAMQNYLAGTEPNNPNSVFKISITRSNNQNHISFVARGATGAGYEGRTRYYRVEARTNLSGGGWSDLPGLYSELPGEEQPVTIALSGAPASSYYRVRVWLQP